MLCSSFPSPVRALNPFPSGRSQLTRCASLPPSKSSTKRQPKNPADFGHDYERIRAELTKSSVPFPTFGNALNWLGKTAFGVKTREASESFAGNFFNWLLRQRVEEMPSPNDPMLIASAAERATEAERAAVLAYWGQDPEAGLATELAVGCAVTIGERRAGGAARRVPDTQLAGRVAFVMGSVRSAVQCSVTQAALVVNKAPEAPQLLALTGPQLAYFRAAMAKLRESFPGVDVDLMAQEDPAVAFIEAAVLDFGLRELRELWDPEALATIEPDELALALRSLCKRPRKSFQYRLFESAIGE